MWSHNGHFAKQNVDQHRKLIQAGADQKAPANSDITMTTGSKPECSDVLIIIAIHMLDREYWSLGFELYRQ